MSVSLVEVMVAASRRLAPLSGECAGHAVLAAADQLLSNPRLVGAREVLIEESGAIRLAGGRTSDERGCDQGLRGLLDGLLAVAHSGGVGLFRVGQRTATGDLGQLVKELEVALIPANRAAARRSLARLHRETERARDAGRLEHASDALPGPAVSREPAPPPPSRVEPEALLPAQVMSADTACVPRQAHSSTHGFGAELSASELDLLAVTEVRFATGPRAVGAAVPQPASPGVEADFAIDVDVDVDMSTRTPEMPVVRTQPLPKVEPRRALHETMPLPPVTTEPRIRTEHETPLEPVFGRRHAGIATVRHEPADIHKTPYLGTLVAPVPYYDPPPRERWQGETWPVPEATTAPPDTSAPADWEEDEAPTDPAPAVTWSASDDGVADASDEATQLAEAEAVFVDASELAEAEAVFVDASELVEAAAAELAAEAAAAEPVEAAAAELAAEAAAAEPVEAAASELVEAAAAEPVEAAASELVEAAAAELAAEAAAAELAEAATTELVEAAAAEHAAEAATTELLEAAATELAEAAAEELAEDDVTEISEDDIMELSEDDVTELTEAPFAACAALAVQPRVITLFDPKPPRVPRTSDVEALLEGFRIAESEPEPERQLVRGLKQLAGITVTPPPVLVRTEGARATASARREPGTEPPSTPATGLPRSEPGAPIRPIPTVRIVGS